MAGVEALLVMDLRRRCSHRWPIPQALSAELLIPPQEINWKQDLRVGQRVSFIGCRLM